MPDVTRDLKGIASAISEVSDALSKLIGLTKDAGSALQGLGTAGSLTGSGTATAAFSRSVSEDDFSTAVGKAGSGAFIAAQQKMVEDQLNEASAAGRVSEITYINEASKAGKRGRGTKFLQVEGGINVAGEVITDFPANQDFRAKFVAEMVSESSKKESRDFSSKLSSIIKDPAERELGAHQINKYTSSGASSYTISDLPRISQMAKEYSEGGSGSKQVAQVIKMLSESNDTNSQLFIAEIRRLSKDISYNSEMLNKAAAEYKQTQSPVSFANMREHMFSTDVLGEQLERLFKSLGGGGGGGDGGAGGISGFIRRWQGPIGGAIGGAIGVASAYNMAGVALGRAALDKELSAEVARGNIESSIFEMRSGMHDMANPENIMKYRADILQPYKKFRFIGTGGLENAMRAAERNEGLLMETMGRERTMGVLSGLGQFALGALGLTAGIATATGTAGLGVGIGAGMGIAGVSQMASGLSGAIGSMTGSPYTAITGGLSRGAVGAAGRLIFDDWDKMSEDARRDAIAQQHYRMLSTAQAYQQAEMRQDPSTLSALSQYNELMSAQMQAAELVGEYAPRANIMLGRFANRGTQTQAFKDYVRDQDLASGSSLSRAAASGKDAYKSETERLYELKDRFSVLGALRAKAVQDAGGAPRYDDRVHTFNTMVNRLDQQIRAREAEAFEASRVGGAAEERFYEQNSRNVNNAKGYAQSSFDSYVLRRHDKELLDPLRGAGSYSGSDTADYGWRTHPITGQTQFHNGIDIAAKIGTPIYASGRGEVVGVGFDPAKSGYFAKIKYDNQMTASYSHMNKYSDLRVGQSVGPSDVIGHVGTSGRSTGPHLHYSVRDAVGNLIDAAQVTQGYGELGPAMPSDTPWARFGISAANYMMRQAQVTNVLGSMPTSAGIRGLQAGDETTQALLGLGMSGLGSFSQQLGAISSLNQVAGGQNNIRLLEDVLSSAVAAGFDKSRTAQNFVRNTTETMNAINATTALTGGMISTAATALGGGLADERTMSLAAGGLKAYGAYTTPVTGVFGAVKMLASAQAGFDFGSGLATSARMNALERMDVIEQLEGKGALSVTARTLMATNPELSKSGLASRLRQISMAEGGAAESMLRFAHFSNIDEYREKFTSGNLSGGERRKLMEEFLFKARDAGAELQMGADAAVGAGINVLQTWGVNMSSADRAGFLRKIKTGVEAIDPALIMSRNYMDKIMSDFGANLPKLSVQGGAYRNFLAAGGSPIGISAEAAKAVGNMDLAGMPITEKLSGKAREAAERTLGGMTTLDLARAGRIAEEQAMGGVQSVRISNWEDLVGPMTIAMSVGGKLKTSGEQAKDLNKK